MANRHLSRSIVLQTLFEWDFGGRNDAIILDILKRNILEFAPGMGDFSFTKDLVTNILKKRKTIDAVIEKAAPEWPLDKISIIDRNVLRIGLYELIFGDKKEVPPKVAINEAIELAKTFSGTSSGKFVNGVLGSVYRELGEPGKDDTGGRKNKEIDFSKLPIEKKGGAVVYSHKDGVIYLALVHDIFGHWTLSKGVLKGVKDTKKETVQEIQDELGILVKIEEELGKNEYIARDPKRGKIRKQVIYYLASAPYQELVLGETGGLDDARWFPLSEIPQLRIYDDILPIITKGITLITQKVK